MKLVFATNNRNKLEEVSRSLTGDITLVRLDDIGCTEELPETGDTLTDNALQKARYVHEKYGYDCFADDTGLEIEALNGRPGVYSARYAGEEKSAEKNMNKVLDELKNSKNRNAVFKTTISLIINNKEYLFEGIVKGSILSEKQGSKGFGYDPIFQPEGHERSFAEMSIEEKNKISHRGIAVKKLAAFLNTLKA